ncbi:MAG TPA: acetyl-CoA carboxylase biotin carboxyl carrier protein [Thermoanaerobaculia bacterium]|nr:acetyl-CoA carboxylase biotin carboxyl carrier protein [Thermoanaerobaculia bacterium]
MNFKELLELIDKVADRGIASVEIEKAGVRVRVDGRVFASAPVEAAPGAVVQNPLPLHPPATSVATAAAAAAAVEAEQEASWHIITSPIVGTFYRSQNPESEAFVSVGDRVGKGSVLCIIEAMKLMNEIESDVDGVVMKVYPQNAQPVEYGEKLFAITL